METVKKFSWESHSPNAPPQGQIHTSCNAHKAWWSIHARARAQAPARSSGRAYFHRRRICTFFSSQELGGIFPSRQSPKPQSPPEALECIYQGQIRDECALSEMGKRAQEAPPWGQSPGHTAFRESQGQICTSCKVQVSKWSPRYGKEQRSRVHQRPHHAFLRSKSSTNLPSFNTQKSKDKDFARGNTQATLLQEQLHRSCEAQGSR